jgi:GNAT superfamily N-acetyltransferase
VGVHRGVREGTLVLKRQLEAGRTRGTGLSVTSTIEIFDEPLSRLLEHRVIPISFRVDSVLQVRLVDGGLGGIAFREQIVDEPYVKDYDARDGEGPTRWLTQFDTSNWGFMAAYVDGRRMGGAVIAFSSPGVDLLERRTDLAALWDLRVDPGIRRSGVGRALFSAAEVWARDRECTQLLIETQNTNVPACRFYLDMGCFLRSIDRLAYPDIPGESRLLWIKELDGGA